MGGKTNVTSIDVAVIGGGPAGISACMRLSKRAGLKIALFESEPELGGIPKSCHIFFGMRDLHRILSGPAYATRLSRDIHKTAVDIQTQATVTRIHTGEPNECHRLEVVSPRGVESYETQFILLTTGCFESSRQARFIPGTRPSGIYTTGSLQQLCNLRRYKPGKKALI